MEITTEVTVRDISERAGHGHVEMQLAQLGIARERLPYVLNQVRLRLRSGHYSEP